jgi:hypothetical protein
MSRVKFISYTGRFPNLCRGTLTVEIEGQLVEIRGFCSGGSVWFDDNWDEQVEEGPWSIDDDDIPREYLEYKDEILSCMNNNVLYGCCGGCV